MRYIQWFLLLPVNLVLSIICILISPVAAFFVTKDKRIFTPPEERPTDSQVDSLFIVAGSL